MALIRPRLTDHYGVDVAQSAVDFAIPFLDEDLPLHVDPFLLWKSPSLQDQSLHGIMLGAFNRLGQQATSGKHHEAIELLNRISECDEVGLGSSANRTGKRIGKSGATKVLSLFDRIPEYAKGGLSHIEEIQFFVDGISRDRISDIACSLLKSFLIDFTIEQCMRVGLPTTPSNVSEVYDHQSHQLREIGPVDLPVHPTTKQPILLVPKRWLRFSPWISFDDYFKHYIPKDERHNKVTWDRVGLLNFNRDNYGVVRDYVLSREGKQADCAIDRLFTQIPVLSAKRKFAEIRALPTGKDQGADKKYEDAAVSLLASMLYPQLDYAADQVRTEGGTHIRDLIFYMNREVDFLRDVHTDFGSRQLVFELKNVAKVEGDHINQLNRYLTGEFGKFGVLVTRNPLPRAMRKNTIDLWSAQRRCIISLCDADLELMVSLFEEKRRPPMDVLKRSYIQFRRECPS